MKKLKLSLDALEVTSFVAHEARSTAGTVKGMDSFYGTCEWNGCAPSRIDTQCLCTYDDGCYPSLYCSGAGPGEPNVTCDPGCMTNANGAC